MHSYSSDMAGVVSMSSVSGGTSLRTSRGSSGVKTANWRVSEAKGRRTTTHKLDDLDEHPVVCAVREQPKKLRREREVLSRILSRELADDVHRRRHHAHVVVAETLAQTLDPRVLAVLLAAGPQLHHFGPAAHDSPHDEHRLLAHGRTRVREHRQQIRREVAREGRREEQRDGGQR